MSDLSEDQSRTLEVSWKVTSIGYSHVERENITMNFITKLPSTTKGFDAIWVIVDHLTKITHFLAIWESSSGEKLANIYVQEIVSHRGLPISILSD